VALPLGNWERISIMGSNAGDTWSINPWFRYTGVAVISSTEADSIAAAALADFQSKVWGPASQPLKGVNAAYTTLTGCRVLHYNNNIIQQSGSAAQSPVAGTSGTPAPPYTALVMTLLTGTAGRSFRGRCYLPATGAPVSGSTALFTPVLTNYALNFAAWLSNANAWLPGSLSGSLLHSVVMTQTGAAPADVNSVRIDDKLDTQRNRENKIRAANFASHSV